LNPISASGVVIDTRGVVLINAHAGQYFLLRDYPFPNNIDCIIRSGSPAQPRYRATLLYLPPAWVDKNAVQLLSSEPVGTGEDDYAFLLITASTNSSPLPSSFSALPVSFTEPAIGDTMVLVSYPAGFIEGITIAKGLYAASAVAVVQQLFTFGDNLADLISIGGTIVSQNGSSGGAAVRLTDGTLQGIIVTETPADSTADRDLRAITLAHIERSLRAHGEGGIATLLSGNLEQKSTNYNAEIAPLLSKKLLDVLQ